MLKKNLFTSALALVAMFGFANTLKAEDSTGRFGIHAGANFMSASAAGSNSDNGFIVGLNMETPLIEGVLFLQPEFSLNRIGAENNSFGGAGTTRFTYLEVPVQLKLKGDFGAVELFGLAGPRVSLLINTSTDIAGFTVQDSDRKAYEFGLYFGGGIAFAMNDHSSLFFMGRYSLGLVDIDETNAEWKSKGFQLVAGLTF